MALASLRFFLCSGKAPWRPVGRERVPAQRKTLRNDRGFLPPRRKGGEHERVTEGSCSKHYQNVRKALEMSSGSGLGVAGRSPITWAAHPQSGPRRRPAHISCTRCLAALLPLSLPDCLSRRARDAAPPALTISAPSAEPRTKVDRRAGAREQDAMVLVKQAMIAVTAAVIFALVYGEGVDPNCLGCLCEASTKCNASTACHTPYPGAYFCGPFLISWAYWADADKPIIEGDNADKQGAFERCVQDLYCGAETVRRYMAKFLNDCDGNGAVTCVDVIRTHKFGRQDCARAIPQDDKFWSQYQECAIRLSLQ